MVALTDPVVKMIRHLETSKVPTTVSPSGEPHAMAFGNFGLVESNTIVVSKAFVHGASKYIRDDPHIRFLV